MYYNVRTKVAVDEVDQLRQKNPDRKSGPWKKRFAFFPRKVGPVKKAGGNLAQPGETGEQRMVWLDYYEEKYIECGTYPVLGRWERREPGATECFQHYNVAISTGE